MQQPRVHPILLIGILSLAASALLDWLASPHLSRGFLDGFVDGLAAACIYGYLLAVRRGELRRL